MDQRATGTRATSAVDIALIVALAALWGSSYSFVKIALGSLTPLTLTAARIAVAAVVLGLLVAARGRKLPRDATYWWRLTLQSLINVAGPFALYAWAQQYVPSSLAGIFNSSTPIVVFLITVLWTHHERVDAERLIGTTVGLAGVIAIIGLDALAGIGNHVLAEIVMLIGTLGYALAAIHGRRFGHVPADVNAAGALAIATVVMVPLAFVVERPLALDPTAGAVLSILYLGVGCTAATFVIYFALVARVGSMNTVSASYLRAGFAVAFGMALLGEAFTWGTGAGLLGVLVGVAAINGQLGRVLAVLRRAARGAASD